MQLLTGHLHMYIFSPLHLYIIFSLHLSLYYRSSFERQSFNQVALLEGKKTYKYMLKK